MRKLMNSDFKARFHKPMPEFIGCMISQGHEIEGRPKTELVFKRRELEAVIKAFFTIHIMDENERKIFLSGHPAQFDGGCAAIGFIGQICRRVLPARRFTRRMLPAGPGVTLGTLDDIIFGVCPHTSLLFLSTLRT